MSARYEINRSVTPNRRKFSTEFEAGPGTGFIAGNKLRVKVKGVQVGTMTLAALLGHLGKRLDGDAATHLVTASGQMQCGLLIVVNDAAIASHQASTLILRTGDVVTLLPPIAGG